MGIGKPIAAAGAEEKKIQFGGAALTHSVWDIESLLAK